MFSETQRCSIAAGFFLALVATASAAPQTYHATLNTEPGFESFFTLDFGGGFVEMAQIAVTDFTLTVDADAGPLGDAFFTDYSQQIESINLPDPMGGATPIPTGAITVEILPGTSGGGSYDALTGQFTTSETYRIHYAGDLSAYGLTDGFVDLPSTSAGLIEAVPGGVRIGQLWSGTYMFPGTPVVLSYTCEANTVAVPEPVMLGGLMLIPLLLLRRFR